jgi:hypothetical protein
MSGMDEIQEEAFLCYAGHEVDFWYLTGKTYSFWAVRGMLFSDKKIREIGGTKLVSVSSRIVGYEHDLQYFKPSNTSNYALFMLECPVCNKRYNQNTKIHKKVVLVLEELTENDITIKKLGLDWV